MIENLRSFEAGPDPFGRTWKVTFRWHQNAISIRHADAVDVKYAIETEGETAAEKVIALPHPLLLKVSQDLNRPITDAWCMRLAAHHLAHMIETWEDMDKTLVTLNERQLRELAQEAVAA
jgi:hypothetical protein